MTNEVSTAIGTFRCPRAAFTKASQLIHKSAARSRSIGVSPHPIIESTDDSLTRVTKIYNGKRQVAALESIDLRQLERQAGEWSLVAGYAGEVATERRSVLGFSPVRGFTRAVLADAAYTIDVNRSLAFEAVVRQNGHGVYAKAEYSRAFGQHWRATAGFALVRGDAADFLGQYRRNSHAILTLRYSF